MAGMPSKCPAGRLATRPHHAPPFNHELSCRFLHTWYDGGMNTQRTWHACVIAVAPLIFAFIALVFLTRAWINYSSGEPWKLHAGIGVAETIFAIWIWRGPPGRNS